MPFVKKIKEEEKEVIVPVSDKREQIISLIKVAAFRLFDVFPRGGIDNTEVGKLADKILEL